MKKSWIIIAALLIVFLIQLFHVQHLKNKIEEQSIEVGLEKVNSKFISSFFTYESIKQRYEQIRPMMTERGFRSTMPSGIEIPTDPDDSPSVSSKISMFRPFTSEIEEEQAEILNEFNIITTFNNVESTTKVLVRTKLKYTKELGWKIDEAEFVSTLN